MTAFDKYRKAAEQCDFSAALTEMEALLIRERKTVRFKVAREIVDRL